MTTTLLLATTLTFLTCHDLAWLWPDTLRQPADLGDRFQRVTALYMLRGLGASPRDDADGTQLRATCSGIPAPWREPLRAARDDADVLDFRALRSVYQRAYRDTRAARGQAQAAPDTVDDLLKRTRFTDWPVTVVALSAVKRKTRVIYRGENASVSRTLDSTTGDPAAPVLETELALRREGSANDWDFYSYDAAGALASEGSFPSGKKPSPLVCLGCHYDDTTGAMARAGF